MLTYTHISSNKRKTVILITSFLVLVTGLGYIFASVYESSEILIFAVLFSIGMSFTSYYYSDKIALSLSKAKEVNRQNAESLYRLVENLCITAGIPVPKIYIIDDTALNAFATGRDPEHSAIVFTTGILNTLEKQELEGVIAHELSHIGNYDIRLSTLVVVLVGVIALLSDWFLRISFFGGKRKENDSQAGAIIFVVGIVLAILSPLIAMIIQLSISRKREYLADASGALLTRYPEGLASALRKLSKDHEPLEVANKATAHMYIVNPLKDLKGKPSAMFSKLFSTHPPIEDRIKRLEGMNL